MKNKSIQVYFQTVTPESAEQGDFAETGEFDTHNCTPDKWDIQDGKTAVDLAVKVLRDQGAVEPSSSQFHEDVWFLTIDADEDIYSGDRTYYTFHLKGFSEAEQREIFNRVMRRG